MSKIIMNVYSSSITHISAHYKHSKKCLLISFLLQFAVLCASVSTKF